MDQKQKRLELHERLSAILGSSNVYYQAPSASEMEYPCIVYKRSRIRTQFADNDVFKTASIFTIIAIYTDPDDELPIKLSKQPQCLHDRQYVVENLYHDVFNMAIL